MVSRHVAPLGAMFILLGCSQPASEAKADAPSPVETSAVANSAQQVTPKPSSTPSARSRPNDLIAAEQREDEACRGGSGDDVRTMQACNRRQVLLKELQDAGWCWGGADIEADKRFVSCKPGDRDYAPGEFDKPYFSDQEIADAANGQ
jgi:uncharacterized lipoprotein YajG